MEKVVLNATLRPVTGKKVGALRREGKLPAVLYGHNFKATPILLDLHDTTMKLAPLTSSQMITINLDGKEHAALIREKQRDFIRNRLIHLDFQVVSLTEKIKTAVSIVLEGTSPAVKDFNGVVVTGLGELEVEAFPQDLPGRILVDISKLTEIGQAIHVRDLEIPEKVAVLTGPDEMVVHITAGAKEEEEVVEEGGPAEPEVIEKGKKEEEEE